MSYFKLRNRFDFNPHPFDIGNPIIQNKAYADNFFLLKIYKLNEQQYSSYYFHHHDWFLTQAGSSEKAFFKHVWKIVNDRIDWFNRLDPFTAKGAAGRQSAAKLESFREFLKTIDKWHTAATLEEIIAEQNREIDRLKAMLAAKDEKLEALAKLEPTEKINITKDLLQAFMHLVQQLQRLKLNDGRNLLNFQNQATWSKIISKHFLHGGEPIPFDTAKNYFYAGEEENKPRKYTNIADKEKLFEIVPISKERAGKRSKNLGG